MSEAVPLSEQIFQRLSEEAASRPRGSRVLGTLRRLREACDDIVSGKARDYARKAGMDATRFGRPGRPILNSKAVQDYVEIRQRLSTMAGDLNSEWTGPHQSTIRGREDLLHYLRQRQAEASGKKFNPERAPRAAKVIDIVATVPLREDRDVLSMEIEKLRRESAQGNILRRALEDMPGIDVDTLIRRDPTAASRRRETTIEPLPPSDRKILRALVERLEDPIILGDFDLTNDGRKIRLAGPPGTWLIEPEELQLLRTLAGRPAGQ